MDDVSRETPSVPPEARRVFTSDRLSLAVRYTELLATEGVVRGLIGPREAPRLWDRHILNSAVMAEVIPDSASVCDVGSGAGLPGLVLAIARPDTSVSLVEPLLRRTTFLSEVVDELELTNVTVVRGRAEEFHGDASFDVVTSRAVAPLDRLMQWSMPLVAPTGALIAMKGRSVVAEIAAARSMLSEWTLSDPEVLEVGSDVLTVPTTLVRVCWADSSRIGWPLAKGAGGSRNSKRREASTRRSGRRDRRASTREVS